MAIEIKELHVKVHMDEGQADIAQSGETTKSDGVYLGDNAAQEHLVGDVTREVLRILKEQKER